MKLDTPLRKVTRASRRMNTALFGILPLVMVLAGALYWGGQRILQQEEDKFRIDFSILVGYVNAQERMLHALRTQTQRPDSRNLVSSTNVSEAAGFDPPTWRFFRRPARPRLHALLAALPAGGCLSGQPRRLFRHRPLPVRFLFQPLGRLVFPRRPGLRGVARPAGQPQRAGGGHRFGLRAADAQNLHDGGRGDHGTGRRHRSGRADDGRARPGRMDPRLPAARRDDRHASHQPAPGPEERAARAPAQRVRRDTAHPGPRQHFRKKSSTCRCTTSSGWRAKAAACCWARTRRRKPTRPASTTTRTAWS